jgi:hypothetical protein
MGFADEAKKAEELAKEHPEQVNKAVDQGEKAAEEHTGHRYDKQIGEGGEQLERHLGGGDGDDQQQQQPQQPQGGDTGQGGSDS